MMDVYNRTIKVYDTEVRPLLEGGDNVLVVAHYYVLRALMSYLESGGPDLMASYSPKNCRPYLYEVEN